MIRKLKKKFTILATISIFILMAILVSIMNLINFTAVVRESDQTLDVVSTSGSHPWDDKPQKNDLDKKDDFSFPHGMSPEVPYESRFFTAIYSTSGEYVSCDLSKIVTIDEETAKEYSAKAMNSSSTRGFIGQYRFVKIASEMDTKIVFLDCGRKLDSFYNFLWISIIVGLSGCVIVFVAFIFVAGHIVRPIAESYEKQKRFISDASHEIKTPLTIIRANVDLLETDGEKEELTEIRTQTERLTELTKNLVYLSKMEEQEQEVQKIDCPVSDLVSETVNSFAAPMHAKEIQLTMDVQPEVSMMVAPDAFRQLVSVLTENAVKYTPEMGTICVSTQEQRKSMVMSVTNTISNTMKEEDLPHVFDRFYRTDASRNSATGGHGIGLSIAKAIVEAHHGSISASLPNEKEFRITVILPV